MQGAGDQLALFDSSLVLPKDEPGKKRGRKKRGGYVRRRPLLDALTVAPRRPAADRPVLERGRGRPRHRASAVQMRAAGKTDEIEGRQGGCDVMRMKLLLGLLVPVVLMCAVTASALGTATRHVSRRATVVHISTRTVPKLGSVLVNARGRTLYMFVPDKRRKVTCVGTCAAVWPPVKLPPGAKEIASRGAKASLLGSDRDPAGGRVATYNKWPLYTYVADSAPGQAKGQALNLNGGYWYVLSPSGRVIHTKLSSGSIYG
jgi:predicted lipoprotein with Yx(FWY)xxD motif